jgi:hypothetical protein
MSHVLRLTDAVPKTTLADAMETHRGKCLRYLRPDEYAMWDALVSVSAQGNVFCRSWWLKALPGDVRILGYFNHGRLVAGIPLSFERRLGLEICILPKLVHTWGVVIGTDEGKNGISREMQILKIFAGKLSQQRVFVQSFHPSLSNWLPFLWNGFRQTTLFSYVLEDLSDIGRLWSEIDSNVRRDIRKAEKNGITIIPCDSDLVAAVARKTFSRQRKTLPYTEDYLRRLSVAAQNNDAGACFVAVDKQGRPHATAFFAWDTKRAYGVAGGADPELRTSGAGPLLHWHILKFCAERTRAFDFSGSMIEGIETFFRGFGGRLVPYNQILKLPLALRAYRAVSTARN